MESFSHDHCVMYNFYVFDEISHCTANDIQMLCQITNGIISFQRGLSVSVTDGYASTEGGFSELLVNRGSCKLHPVRY